jgi:hypothetical protein
MNLYENKGRWLIEHITLQTRPNWPCPTCKIGELTFPENWARRELSAKSKRENSDYLARYPDMTVEHFSGILLCSNNLCKETVANSGLAGYEGEYDEKEFLNYVRYYSPKHFYPTLNIFRVPSDVPKSVSDCILSSFSHFWNDYSACVNSLRRAIEFLLDALGITELQILDQRIVLLSKTNALIAEKIKAIKWIGNAGSHKDSITKNDLIDAYILLEDCLNKLYPSKYEEEIKKIATEVNVKKGLRSKP